MLDIKHGKTIVTVIHDADGDWQFLSSHGADMEKVMFVSLQEILNHGPTLFQLSNLPAGKQVDRDGLNGKWTTSNLD